MSGDRCSTGCRTRDHASFAACMRDKGVRPVALESVSGPGFALERQKAWDRELNEYAAARRQGIQPATTNLKDIRKALDASDAMGKPYRADA